MCDGLTELPLWCLSFMNELPTFRQEQGKHADSLMQMEKKKTLNLIYPKSTKVRGDDSAGKG